MPRVSDERLAARLAQIHNEPWAHAGVDHDGLLDLRDERDERAATKRRLDEAVALLEMLRARINVHDAGLALCKNADAFLAAQKETDRDPR